MNKVDLQSKVDSLTEEIKFFKHLYEEVRTSLISLAQAAPLASGLWSILGWFLDKGTENTAGDSPSPLSAMRKCSNLILQREGWVASY